MQLFGYVTWKVISLEMCNILKVRPTGERGARTTGQLLRIKFFTAFTLNLQKLQNWAQMGHMSAFLKMNIAKCKKGYKRQWC